MPPPTSSPSRFERLVSLAERVTRTDLRYLATGGFWLTLQLAVAAVSSFALAVLFGHFASPDLYGNYKYALSLAALLSLFSLPGLTTAIPQAVARGKEGALRQGFRLSLRWGALLTLAACSGAAYSAYRGNLFLAGSLLVIALASPFVNAFALYDGFLVGKRTFARSARFSILLVVASSAALALALMTGRAILLVVTYFIVTGVLTALFYWRTARSAANDELDPELPRYARHLSVMNALGLIADKLDAVIVFGFLGPAQLALYAYAVALPEQLKGLVKNILPLALPRFAARPFEDIRRNLWLRMGLLTAGLAIMIALYVLVAPLLFRWFFPLYQEAVPFSRLYAVSLVFSGIITLITGALQAHKKTLELYYLTNVPSGALIISLVFLVPGYGLLGAIAAQFIYRTLMLVLAVWQFARTTA